METRLIGLKTANQMLPLLKSITKDIIKLWNIIIAQRKVLEKAEKDGIDTEDVKLILNESIDKINEHIKEIEVLGCFVQEFKRGIINVPSLCQGRRIFFSVAPIKEDKIKFWHEIDEMRNDKQLIGNLNVLMEN